MKRFNPLTPQTKPRFNPLESRDQVYDILILESPGELDITVPNSVVAEYIPTTLTRPFVITTIPDSYLPLYIRDAGRRFALVGNTAITASAPQYDGELLSPQAIFEYWSQIVQTITPAELQIRISYRTQVVCCDTSPTEWPTFLYVKTPREYPITFPI